jgi:hypothetical protein
VSAYEIVRILHNLIRWVVVIAGVLAAATAIVGWLRATARTELEDRLGMLFTISLDTQVLLGLLLYFVLSPITTNAFSSFGDAMSDDRTRFFLVEHITVMIIAAGLAHAGRSLAKKAGDERAAHARAAIFYTLAIIAILVAIPWQWSPLFRLS